MGYESKLYIIDQNDLSFTIVGTNEKVQDIYNRIIGTYDLCKLGDSVDLDVFDKELEGKIFIGEDKEVDEDYYGEHLRYCDNLPLLIAELKNAEKKCHYRRLKPIIAMLKELEKMKHEFNRLIVVHFGH